MVAAVSDLTENEVWDRLRTSLRAAVSDCETLATLPAKGPTYRRMIEHLELIEGAARQIGFFREDMRWMAFAFEMYRFRDRIGEAIRAHRPRAIFTRMAQVIRGALAEADKLKDAKTERRGPILPKAKPGPHRATVPVYVRNSGLLVPSSVH